MGIIDPGHSTFSRISLELKNGSGTSTEPASVTILDEGGNIIARIIAHIDQRPGVGGGLFPCVRFEEERIVPHAWRLIAVEDRASGGRRRLYEFRCDQCGSTWKGHVFGNDPPVGFCRGK